MAWSAPGAYVSALACNFVLDGSKQQTKVLEKIEMFSNHNQNFSNWLSSIDPLTNLETLLGNTELRSNVFGITN